MRMFHRCRQFPGGAGRILEHREIFTAGCRFVGGGKARNLIEQAGIGDDDAQAVDLSGDVQLLGVCNQQFRLAVIDPQPQPVEPEQGEHRYADRAHHHRAEQAYVERQRRLEHERNAIARLDAVLHEPVREARGTGGNLVEAQRLVGAVRMGNPHSDPA